MLVNRAARWVEVKRNEMEIQLCEKKREGRDLPTFLSPPLIKFMHFNWSKLNFAFSFFFFSFYLFLFISFLILRSIAQKYIPGKINNPKIIDCIKICDNDDK